MILKRIGLAVMVIGMAALGVDAVASAQTGDYPPRGATVSVSNQTPPAGGKFTVTVTGCARGENVRFSLPTVVPVTVTCVAPAALASGILRQAPQPGTATAEMIAPLQPGPYDGTVELLTSNVTLPFRITVAAISGDRLPASGTDSSISTTWYAFGALVLGGGLLAVSQVRRRRTATA